LTLSSHHNHLSSATLFYENQIPQKPQLDLSIRAACYNRLPNLIAVLRKTTYIEIKHFLFPKKTDYFLRGYKKVSVGAHLRDSPMYRRAPEGVPQAKQVFILTYKSERRFSPHHMLIKTMTTIVLRFGKQRRHPLQRLIRRDKPHYFHCRTSPVLSQ